ncbi:hypothetical protein [Allorhizocola rhizosphaerae]|uniref:hypothetical protein n=1 Tax=Allorhizocola rhizosphaerae TaxID=1872709 RepID=UPI000E3CECBE|nr:hypothetical protein [Allorhizocola rhizosphaerae]
MAERIVIDTDDLREVSRVLQGALQRLGDIRLDLARAAVELQRDAGAHTGYQQVMAGLESLGAQLTADHDTLAHEVLALEAEEGLPPANAPKQTEPAPQQPHGDKQIPVWILRLVNMVRPAPEPWDKPWVNADGSMPAQPSAAARAGFGVSWEERGRFDSGIVSGSGVASASAGGWAYGEADHRVDEKGNHHVSAKAGVGGEVTAHAEGRIDAGPVHAQGQADAALRAKAEAEAAASIGPDGASASAKASAEATASASASGEVGVDGVGEAKGHAEAEAGAKADAAGAVSVGKDGVSASGGVGAEAGAEAGAGVSVGGSAAAVGTGVEVKAGVGVEVRGGGSLGWEKVGFELDLGIALGVGAGFSLDFSISPKEIFEAFKDPIGTVEGLASGAADIVGDAASSVADAVSDFFDPAVADKLEDASAEDGAVGDLAAAAAQHAADAVGAAEQQAGAGGLADAAAEARDAAQQAAEAASTTAQQAAEAAGDTAVHQTAAMAGDPVGAVADMHEAAQTGGGAASKGGGAPSWEGLSTLLQEALLQGTQQILENVREVAREVAAMRAQAGAARFLLP